MEPIEVGKHLVVDPRVCFGKMTFKGTRVPVKTILAYVAKGETIERILVGWPQLTREAVQEAIQLAAAALLEKYPVPAEATYEPARPGRSA